MSNNTILKNVKNETVGSNLKVLETLYTIIIGLALTAATAMLADTYSTASSNIEKIGPIILYVSFLITIVPFYQGMGRFLYETHIVRPIEKPDASESPLLLDTYAFIFLSILLFVLGRQLNDPLNFFYVWSALLIVDIIWTCLVWGFQKSRKPIWALNNFIWLALAWSYLLLVVDTPGMMYPSANYIYGFVLFEVGRTLTDYYLNWDFYFPKSFRGEDEKNVEIVYLAGPYSNDAPNNSPTNASSAKREARFLAITEVAKVLVENESVVYSPLTMTHPIDIRMKHDPGSAYWVQFDEAFMQHCSKIMVLKLPGWDMSSGIKREIEYFKERGSKIEYLDPAEYGVNDQKVEFEEAFK